MTRKLMSLTAAVAIAVCFSSCYVQTFSVGEGAKTGLVSKKKSHYLIGGLAPLATADPKTMANGAKDYEVTIKHSFVDGLIASLTFGIYTPTTTVVVR